VQVHQLHATQHLQGGLHGHELSLKFFSGTGNPEQPAGRRCGRQAGRLLNAAWMDIENTHDRGLYFLQKCGFCHTGLWFHATYL
jgi:hypothetical protein